MAQYKTGTVSVTNGSATVTGSGTLWSGEIAAGDLFTIVGDNAWYEVASVGSNTSITLSANYAGTTGSGKSYAISRDFTTRLALPYPQKGDIETASIIKRAFEQIDTETNIATANYSATSAPTANDDSGDGYSIGSWWVNVTSDEAYLCVDSTVGAAVWTKISVDVPSEIVSLLAGQSVSMASLTLSGGTANGVLYLNGSKVATSGSALWFDGSNLGVGNNLATTVDNNNGSGKLVVGTGSGSQGMTIYSGSSSGNEARITFANSSTGSGSYSAQISYKSGDAAVLIYNNNAERYRINSDGTAIWSVAGSEAMRLTSTGLGVGTSSPGAKLDVTGTFNGTQAVFGNTSGRGLLIGTALNGGVNEGSSVLNARGAGNGQFLFQTDGTTRMTLNDSGNLGLGVTPSAWATVTPAIELKNGVHFAAINTGTPLAYLGANCYYDGSNWIYKVSANYAARYELNAGGVGAHGWFTTSSGTAGATATFTQSMTLDASGRLGIGTTGPGTKLAIAQDGSVNNQYIQLVDTQTSGVTWQIANNATNVVGMFGLYNATAGAYRLLLSGDGNLLVGTTSNSRSSRLRVDGDETAYFTGYGSSYGIGLWMTPNASSSGGNATAISLQNVSNTTVGTITTTASATAYNTSSDYRLKENIQDVTGSGAFIDALQPRTWNWKVDGSAGAGFIAHELQAVSPSSVTGTKDAVDADGNPDYQAVEYGSAEVIAMLVAEVKSLRKRLADAGIA